MKLSDLPVELLAARPHLFSPALVFVPRADMARMREIIAAVEEVVALKLGADGTAPSASGVFMGYDFHLTPEGPKLIEINTNAGGGLLAALQAERDDVLEDYLEMFRAECAPRELNMVAIVDEAPEQQYLYPELVGFRRLFEAHGIRAVICAPDELMICHGGLWYSDGVTETRIDLVYNRLTDFTLDMPAAVALRLAWLHEDTVVTPNPRLHALYADKKNLVALTDPAQLAAWGVAEGTRRILLNGIPRTEAVTVAHAEDFWRRRRGLFFKPACGFGSRGAYRGDKVTKRVFAEILADDYVAQAYAPPSTVKVEVAGQMTELKADIRNYVYRGRVQLVAARLYQGQTTNFRTPGGGFAKVVEA
ncbi:hypothetical protein [Sulfuricystis multivorans]|uniref:hypothetical protein n=1 Tax=Sulfuricystis multivorans TaxID=2211108 RepID=UPI000F827F9C|nr:hypothetical protein [Sulfuricystis multivorans]